MVRLYIQIFRRLISNAIDWLSSSWGSIVSVFIGWGMVTYAYASKTYLEGLVNNKDYFTWDNSNNIRVYDEQCKDSLRLVIDSLQTHYRTVVDSMQMVFDNTVVEKTRTVVLLTENMMPLMMILTMTATVCTIIGFYKKFSGKEIEIVKPQPKKRVKK